MKELVLKSVRYFSFVLIFLLAGISCNKDQNSLIPSIPFSYSINLTIHNEVSIPGNSIFISGIGFGGVIVYCELEGSYHAFDATCTHEVLSNCHLGNDGVIGSLSEACPCCGSEFILLGGGYPSKGPAAAPLRNYRTTVSNGFLRIYNN